MTTWEVFNGDVLTLGGIPFTGYSTPDVMAAGGKQAMQVHKLPGGSRVIDTLGPDENQIAWSGHMLDDLAYEMALTLDALRAQGAVVELQFGGQTRQVVIEHFTYAIRRLPVWLEYAIVCTVWINPLNGVLGGAIALGAIDNLLAQDTASALIAGGGTP